VRADKEKIRKEKKPDELKPYYKVGPIPSGFREARQDEALKAGKYGEYGKYKIDPQDYKDWQVARAVYEPNLQQRELMIFISALKIRLKNLKKKYNYTPHGISRATDEEKTKFEEHKEQQKKEFDVLARLINKYYKDYLETKATPYQQITFDIKELPKPSKPLKTYDIEPFQEPETKKIKKIKKEEIVFQAQGQPELVLLSSHFIQPDDPRESIILKPKTALKLYLKNIRLDKKLYSKEDQNKYFFSRKTPISGGLIGMYNTYIDYRQKNRTFTTKVQKLIKKFGNIPITSIVINRTPVQSFISPLLNVLTFGDFKKKIDETPYDKLYHLRLELNQRFTIEKNEVINMDSPVPKAQPDTEKRTITSGLTNGMTLNTMIDKAIKGMGQFNFFNYSATKNNCQDFCIGLLKNSGVGDKEDYEFIKQDIESVFRGKPILAKFMDGLTGFAGETRTLMGGMITSEHEQPGIGSKVQSVLFARPEWNIKKAHKWLLANGYHHLVPDIKPNHIRFRQIDPEMLKLQGYEYRTLKLSNGIELIIGYKKSLNIKKQYD
jgi:uncharacterized membrane-anchored protein YhcB (DUF1043 family)